jgi:hypothetical protein
VYCPNCGVAVADDEKSCPACFFDLKAGLPPAPKNYLAWSIVVTLFCCVPLGIAAIIYSAQVNKKMAMGDFAGAEAASKMAKRLIIISVVLGVLFALGYLGNIANNFNGAL